MTEKTKRPPLHSGDSHSVVAEAVNAPRTPTPRTLERWRAVWECRKSVLLLRVTPEGSFTWGLCLPVLPKSTVNGKSGRATVTVHGHLCPNSCLSGGEEETGTLCSLICWRVPEQLLRDRIFRRV